MTTRVRKWGRPVPPTGMRTTTDDADPMSTVCEVLSHPVRRSLLRLLRETGPTTAERAAGRLTDAAGRPDGAGAGGDTLEVALHHVHLPKMAAAGVVEYDPASGTVAPDGTARVAYALLDGLEVADLE